MLMGRDFFRISALMKSSSETSGEGSEKNVNDDEKLPGWGTEPLQLSRVLQVPDDWLSSFDKSEEARRLAEIQGDAQLLERIMWAGYKGPEYDQLEDRLIRYGYQVLRVWLLNGNMFSKCAEKGTRLYPTELSRDPREAQALAGETVVVSVRKFRTTVLIPRIWRPDGGASLQSFYIGQCLIRFPNIYRRWLNENGFIGADALRELTNRRDSSLDGPIPPTVPPSSDGNPEAQLGQMYYLSLAPDKKAKEVLEYVAQGFTVEEIAELTGDTIGAIKSRLYRLRQANQRSNQPKRGGR
jgi:hypothetical protein